MILSPSLLITPVASVRRQRLLDVHDARPRLTTGANRTTRIGRTIPSLLAVFSVLLVCSCSQRQWAITDPYESANRPMFDFSYKLDQKLVAPVAAGYHRHTNQKVQMGVHNLITNINTSGYIVNDLLQLRFHRFFADSARLLINSSVGLLGLIDVARHLGVPKEKNDFGKTLAYWGWREAAQVVVPLFGFLTVRDLTSAVLELSFLHPIRFLNFSAPESLLFLTFNLIDTRTELLSLDPVINDPSLIDRYAFLAQNHRNSRVVFIKANGEVESEVIWSDEELEWLD